MMEFQSQQFTGPLDLLLQLIGRAKIDIKDIFLSEITEQYLLAVAGMEEMDMDSASEFISMAATLLHIKSRSLLPKPEEDVDVEEEKRQLILNLQEYRRIKEVTESLSQLEEVASGYYYRLPDEFVYGQPDVVLEGVGLEQLVAGFMDVLKEREERERPVRPVEIQRRQGYPISRKLAQIRALLQEKTRIEFLELFPREAERDEIVAAFLAILELIFANEAVVHQSEAFGKMVIDRL